MKQFIFLSAYILCLSTFKTDKQQPAGDLFGQQKDTAYQQYPDSASYPQNTLARLQDMDSIVLNFYSTGCFHTSVSKFTITKEREKFVARLFNASLNMGRKKTAMSFTVIAGDLIQSVTLNDEQVAFFSKFENELNQAMDMGCTTVDTYQIRSKFWNIDRKEGSCKWSGYSGLLRKIFFIKGGIIPLKE